MTAPLPVGVNGATIDMTRVDQTFGATTLGYSALTAIALPLLELDDAEAETAGRLTNAIMEKRWRLQLRDAYFNGQVRVKDLGISIPPAMRDVHIAMGWPRVAVEALDLRLNIDGFMYPDSSDVDEDLEEIWVGNDMDAEHGLGNLDAMVFGCGYVAVGSPAAGPNVIDTPPLITVESPLDLAVEWNPRTRQISAAFRLYMFEGSQQATLYLPDQTVSLVMTANGWSVTGRDVHRLGVVTIERIVNRSRTYDRHGASEITPELMSLTDQGCRTLLGLAVAGEFYSAPQRYILGAQQSAFQGADGKPKTAWETYLGRVLALEADEQGQKPEVGQFTPYNPAVFTQVIDSLAQRVSALTGVSPRMLGFTTSNPTSADAIRSDEMELTRRADKKTLIFTKPWRNIMKYALLIRGGGTLPDAANRIRPVWASTATPTVGATSDAVTKQIASGYLPATSDVTGEMLGYSAAQRRRIENDRKADQGASFLDELAHSAIGKAARVDGGLTRAVGPVAVGSDGIPRSA